MDVIMSQTNYTKEEAEARLLELKTPIAVIRDYLAKPKEAKVVEKDAAQLIHHSIRKFMEEAFEKR